MSDERKLSRRASLRGIVATGAIISGTGLSAGTVSASEKKVDSIKEIDFKDCHSMAVHLKDGHDKIPITSRAYNDDSDRIENIQQTIKKKDLLPYKIWEEIHDGNDHEDDLDDYDDHDDKKKGDDHDEKCLCGEHDDDDDKKQGDHDRKYVWTFDIYQYYDHAIDADDKILSVKVGDKRIKNTNDCAKKYSNDYDKKGDIDTDDIGLVAICVNSDYNTARYRVDNWNKKAVTVQYDVYNTDRGGEVMIEPKSSTYFDVEASGSGGEATVRLFYEGEEIDVKASNTRRDCIAKKKVSFSVNDIDYSKRKTEFYLHDGTDFDRTFHYHDSKTGATGKITVHDGPASAETFWLSTPHCKTSLKLYYQGHVVGKIKNEKDLDGPVVNRTQKESYETIQAAVDDANEGDTIIVCEDQELDDTVDVDVADLTIKGFDKPTIDGNGNSPVFEITADGVTIEGLGVTNPDQLLGIRVDVGVDGATIKNNHIFEIGPTGNLGVTGIIVGQGDHDNIKISDNTIEDLQQTDNGSFATVNGILFDADNDDPGTITDVQVKDNDIRNLDSTTAPLGIVVQHNVDDLKIKENEIKDLVADNDFGPGSFTTFAQGISIDSPETNDFDIVKNTIKDIESNDGFFPEDIKIEPPVDVSGIEINDNNLLSAIGLNNANGDNPEIDAEDNFWGDDDGPIVIENNDDDGDVPTPDHGEIDLDDFDASAVTENVDFEPFAEEKQ